MGQLKSQQLSKVFILHHDYNLQKRTLHSILSTPFYSLLPQTFLKNKHNYFIEFFMYLQTKGLMLR